MQICADIVGDIAARTSHVDSTRVEHYWRAQAIAVDRKRRRPGGDMVAAVLC
jgi:hypothetical protein